MRLRAPDEGYHRARGEFVDTGAARSVVVDELDHVAGGDSRSGSDVTIVGVRGTIDRPAAPRLQADLERLLRSRHRVVVDLSHADLAHAGAVHLFADALAAAGGWPTAVLLLAAPAPTLASALDTSHVAEAVPVHHDVATALAHVQDRPALVHDCWHFGVDPRAPRRARANLRRVCAAWDVDTEVCEAAETAVTELVTNAVEHAASRTFVEVARRRDLFRLEVRDWNVTTLPEVVLPSPSSARGRGLAMVAAVSTDWGVHTHADGKTVWVDLAT